MDIFRSTITALTLIVVLITYPTRAEEPPVNSYLADSSWPLFHRNGYAQASGILRAPIGADVRYQRLDNPKKGTAPWTVFLEPYSDGSQAAISNTQKGVVKWLLSGNTFKQVSYTALRRGRMDFDWNVAALNTGEVVVTSIKQNRFYFLKDQKPDCPTCELAVARYIDVPKSVGELTIHFSISYDGHILVLMKGNKIAAISPDDGRVRAVHSLGAGDSAYSYHNAFANDETGRIFVSWQTGVSAIDWDGAAFRTAWSAQYDFRGPGCKKVRRASRLRERMRTILGRTCTGTGTTPTLLGSSNSGIVVMTDGHQPQNHLLAFWRREIPEDWAGYPGESRRLAGKLPLPYSSPLGEGYTAENSPAVMGKSIFVAQWAGFNPDCSPPKGVQRVDWNADKRRLELAWVNPNVHFNGVPTASASSGLVYGLGRGDGCNYAYRGLDVGTGEVRLDVSLGEGNEFTDQGNQQAIADDGSIVIGVRKGTLRIYTHGQNARASHRDPTE